MEKKMRTRRTIKYPSDEQLKARNKATKYYRERRREDGGEYAEYMRVYMRMYRAEHPTYRQHEREYNRHYAKTHC